MLFLICLIFSSNLWFLSLYLCSWSLNLSTRCSFSWILDSNSLFVVSFPAADISSFFSSNYLYFYSFISLDSAYFNSWFGCYLFFLFYPGSKTISIVCLVLTIARFWGRCWPGTKEMDFDLLRLLLTALLLASDSILSFFLLLLDSIFSIIFLFSSSCCYFPVYIPRLS